MTVKDIDRDEDKQEKMDAEMKTETETETNADRGVNPSAETRVVFGDNVRKKKAGKSEMYMRLRIMEQKRGTVIVKVFRIITYIALFVRPIATLCDL